MKPPFLPRLLAALLLSSFLLPPSSFAQTPSPTLIPFQGQLTNQQGVAYTAGQYTIVFNLYNQAVGGTSIWTERHQKVGVINGMVNVFLGSITAFTATVDFSQVKYLGITIDADDNPVTADPEMVPRQMIIPAFYARNSEKMGGYSWANVFDDSDNNSINGFQLGTLKSLAIADNSLDSSKLLNQSIGIDKLSGTLVSALTGTLQQGAVVPTMTALEAIAVGDAVAVSRDAGNNVKLIKASASSGTKSAFFGFARTAATAGQAVTVQQFGPMSGFSGLSGGSAYYLGTSDGAIASSLPPGNLIQVYVGYALSNDTLFIDPFGVTKRWSASNFWGDGTDGSLVTAGNVNLDSAQDQDVIVKHYTQLTIAAGHTLTVDDRCRGLVIYVDGNCTINGTLSMTGRGAFADPSLTDSIAATGIRLARRKSGANETLAASDVGGAGAGGVGLAWRTAEAKQPGINANGRIYPISRGGGTGGAPSTALEAPGNVGNALVSGTGGGGSGGVSRHQSQPPAQSGAGGAGTCYSGGAGGGGFWTSSAGGAGGDGAPNGGPGGDGAFSGAGGAGNPGKRNAENGTGGLLVLLVRGNLSIAGTIESDGKQGGGDFAGGGGGSGGGRVIVLHAGTLTQPGQIRSAGGAGGTATVNAAGGAGGAGAVTIEQIDP